MFLWVNTRVRIHINEALPKGEYTCTCGTSAPICLGLIFSIDALGKVAMATKEALDLPCNPLIPNHWCIID